MSIKWQHTSTQGIRYYEHPTRMHGLKKDRNYYIHTKIDGTPIDEAIGWASRGMTLKKARKLLDELCESALTGEGPSTLKERRNLARKAKIEEEKRLAQEAKENITYDHFFNNTYFPNAQANKGRRSWEREETFHRLWVSPVIGKKPLKKIAQLDIERIKKNLFDKGRTPRTVHYCLATIRQVYNFAISTGTLDGKNPIANVKKPKIDNKRLRFLTKREASDLLEELAKRSKNLHDIALVSLRCGLRAGEVFSLEWGDVDQERKILTLRDTKSGRNRVAYMTLDVAGMFQQRYTNQSPNELVFSDRNGKKRLAISKSFRRAINELGLNNGVTDNRQKVCFHTLRHTFASWLVENGTDLYTVKEILGHSTIAMTERYAHLAPNSMKKAIQDLDFALNQPSKIKSIKTVS